MQHDFPQTDLARLVTLGPRVRCLALLAALRFISSEDMVVAGFDANDAAALIERGTVLSFSLQRRMTDASSTVVLALTRRGARELAREGAFDPDTIPSSTLKSSRRSAMFMDHSIALSRIAIRLAISLSSPGAPARLISWEQRPDRLAVASVAAPNGMSTSQPLIPDAVATPNGMSTSQPLIPDAVATLDGPRGREAFLVEVDRGSERPSYLGNKAAGYLRFWIDGGPERRLGAKAFRVLTVANDAKRTERLMQAIRESTRGSGAGLFWFASEPDITSSPIPGRVWSTLRQGGMSLW